MCKHQYAISTYNAPKTCFIHEDKEQLGIPNIPIDKHGYCLFHSKDKEWKLANNFNAQVNQLLQFMLEERTYKSVDFRGFHFVAPEGEGIEWKDLTTYKVVNLCGASFDTSFSINN